MSYKQELYEKMGLAPTDVYLDAACAEVDRIHAENLKLTTALKAVMGDIDYTNHACSLTDMVGACLSRKAIKLAHEALEASKTK